MVGRHCTEYDGVYVDGDLYCEGCYRREFKVRDGCARFGEADSPLFVDAECDTPQHCSKCHRPMEHSLTSDGVRYVLDAMREELRKGRAEYSKALDCYQGTYYEGSRHVDIIMDWARMAQGNGLCGRDRAFVDRFLSWTRPR